MEALEFWQWVALGIAAGTTGLLIRTWVVVHQAAAELRAFYRRENARHQTQTDLRFEHNRGGVR